MVQPSNQIPTSILSLSALDSQPFLRFNIEYLLIYSTTHLLDRPATTALVKTALAQALVPYYPLAGRLLHDPTGSNQKVICQGQGALFMEAVSNGCSAFDFHASPTHVNQWRNLLSLHFHAPPTPLVVQLTWIGDGAAALAVGFTHSLCDGIGSLQFLNAFAEFAKGGFASGPCPIWDRHLLDPLPNNDPRPLISAHPEFDPVEDLSRLSTLFEHSRLTPTSTCFNLRRVRELKTRALSTSRAKELSYTTFEVVAAHVWRCWGRALSLDPSQTLRLLFSVNVRGLVKPNLPDGYYGNGFVLGCAKTSAIELSEKGLGHAAMLVRTAKERVGDEYVREAVELVSGSGGLCPDPVGVLIVSQWSRLGLEKVDFGLGKPVHVGPVCSDRYCLLLPVCDRKEAVKVMVAVPNSAVNHFRQLIRCYYL